MTVAAHQRRPILEVASNVTNKSKRKLLLLLKQPHTSEFRDEIETRKEEEMEDGYINGWTEDIYLTMF